jgi:glycosyltransferase involved in cell wall biosynthesis
MRVLHVVESMNRGGAESVVVEHVRNAGPGFEPLVCALNLDGPALAAARAAGGRTFVLGKRGPADGLRQLAALMRRERVEVVNGHNATGGLYAALAARMAGVPVAFRTEHTIHFRGRHSPLYPVLEPLATALTRRVVCVCQAVLESHASRLPWAARRFVTVANGISPAPHTRPREAVRRELGLAPEERVALTIGSLSPQKAQDRLLAAFAIAASAEPRARLLVAGEGPRRALLERRIAELGLPGRVRLLGDRDDVADLLEAADLFVLSSRREGLPITLIEAMRAGRAAVSTRIGGTPEVVEDGVTGLLVPVGDDPALAAALAGLLGDEARCARFGEAGRRRWHERFTAERMVRATEALYRDEVAKGAPARGAAKGRAA